MRSLRGLLEGSPLAASVSQTPRGMDGDPGSVALGLFAVAMVAFVGLGLLRWAWRRWWVRSRQPRATLLAGVWLVTLVRSALLIGGIALAWVGSNVAHGLDLDPEWGAGSGGPGWWPLTILGFTGEVPADRVVDFVECAKQRRKRSRRQGRFDANLRHTESREPRAD